MIGVPAHSQSSVTTSFSVVGSPSSQASPMFAERPGQSNTGDSAQSISIVIVPVVELEPDQCAIYT